MLRRCFSSQVQHQHTRQSTAKSPAKYSIKALLENSQIHSITHLATLNPLLSHHANSIILSSQNNDLINKTIFKIQAEKKNIFNQLLLLRYYANRGDIQNTFRIFQYVEKEFPNYGNYAWNQFFTAHCIRKNKGDTKILFNSVTKKSNIHLTPLTCSHFLSCLSTPTKTSGTTDTLGSAITFVNLFEKYFGFNGWKDTDTACGLVNGYIWNGDLLDGLKIFFSLDINTESLKSHTTLQSTSRLIGSSLLGQHPTYITDLLKFVAGPSSLGNITTTNADVDRVFEILIQAAIRDKDWIAAKGIWEGVKHLDTPKSTNAVLYALGKLGEVDLCNSIVESTKQPTITFNKSRISNLLFANTLPPSKEIMELYTQIPVQERDNDFFEILASGNPSIDFMEPIVNDWINQGLCARVQDLGMEKVEKGFKLLVQKDSVLAEELAGSVDVENDLGFVFSTE